jgi:hypothetical protein
MPLNSYKFINAGSIDLNSGFEVKSGSEFEITIEHGCE